MEEKTNKQFPIFWTYIERNGEKTIHQVRFKALCVKGVYETNSMGHKRVEIYKSVFQIAGRNGIFIGCSKSNESDASLKQYFPLDKVFATKELAEYCAKGKRGVEEHFYSVNGEDGHYSITHNNPLLDCEWSWDRYVPSNMKIVFRDADRNGRSYELLGGYTWTGLEAKLLGVDCKNEKIELANDITVHNSLHYALFDMVSCNWLGEFSKEYYKTKEECENANKVKVYTFD